MVHLQMSGKVRVDGTLKEVKIASTFLLFFFIERDKIDTAPNLNKQCSIRQRINWCFSALRVLSGVWGSIPGGATMSHEA